MQDAQVILEVPGAWFENPIDGPRHQRFFASILMALSDLAVTVRPLPLRFGADDAPRLSMPNQLIISYHSKGSAGNILRLKESYIPPFYTMDRTGYSGFSELANHPERFTAAIDAIPLDAARAFVFNTAKHLKSKNLSKYKQAKSTVFPFPDYFVFQPLQTADDPVAELAILDQLDVLAEVAAATEALGWSVVVKRHPFCNVVSVSRRIRNLRADFPNLIETNASIHALIGHAQAVIGANSGVLFEALVQGAHVITFGKSDFAQATTAITALSEIPGALLGRDRVDLARQTRFVSWYLQHYCVRADDFAAIRERISEALRALDIQPSSFNAAQLELYHHFSYAERRRRDDIKSCADV